MVEKKYLDFCKFYAKFGLLLNEMFIRDSCLYESTTHRKNFAKPASIT